MHLQTNCWSDWAKIWQLNVTPQAWRALPGLINFWQHCWLSALICPHWLTHWSRDEIDGVSDDIFKRIFFNENIWIYIKISLKFVLKGPINNDLALLQIMAWRLDGAKPLSEPMMDSLLMHICVTRSQWLKPSSRWCASTDALLESSRLAAVQCHGHSPNRLIWGDPWSKR